MPLGLLRRLWLWLRLARLPDPTPGTADAAGARANAPLQAPDAVDAQLHEFDASDTELPESDSEETESALEWCIDRSRSADAVQRTTGIAGAAAYGIAAIEPLLRAANDPGYVPTAIVILERIAARGDRAAVLDGLFKLYGQADAESRQRIIATVATLQAPEQPAAIAAPAPVEPSGELTTHRGSSPATRRTEKPAQPPEPPRATVAGRAQPIVAVVENLLRERRTPLRARVIARELIRSGHPNVDRRTINQVLYANLNRFEQNANWEWSPAGGTPLAMTATAVKELEDEVEPAVLPRPLPAEVGADDRLYLWQIQALEAWYSSGRRGIIQAITGAGKTRLGLAAVERHLKDPSARAAVVVPTVVLVNQWKVELAAWLGVPPSEIGQCGGGANDDLSDARVTVYVVNSAAEYLADDVRSSASPVLLVADECHRYGAETFKAAIEGAFTATLGLSATPERSFDMGMEETVVPALGPIVFRYEYADALRDGVISEFDVAFVALDFTGEEAREYEALDAEVGRLKRAVESRYPELRRGGSQAQYFAILTRLAKSDDQGAVRAYLDRLAARKNWVIQASAREHFVEWFVRDARQGSRTFVFHENIAGADWIAEALTDAGVPAASHHSGKSQAERQAILQAFREGALHAITAARTLDEGVDVPDANVAVIAAGSSVTRQQIQRAGRVLRKVREKRAKIVRLYIAGSREDPELRTGGNEFETMMQSLGRSSRFAWPADSSRLIAWLGGARVATPAVEAPTQVGTPLEPKVVAPVAGPPASVKDLTGLTAGYWGSQADWPTAAAIIAGAEADPSGPQWAVENPSALAQIREAFASGEINLLAMTRLSTWPFSGRRGFEALQELRSVGLPIYFCFEGLLSTTEQGWREIEGKLRPKSGPPATEVPEGMDPEMWKQEAGWRDFRRNWPRK